MIAGRADLLLKRGEGCAFWGVWDSFARPSQLIADVANIEPPRPTLGVLLKDVVQIERCFERAARWDGWLAPATSPDGTPTMARTPEQIAGMVATIYSRRVTDAPFEVAVDGYTEPDDRLPHAYEEAGATWWLESIHGMRGGIEEMMARVQAGPPGKQEISDQRRWRPRAEDRGDIRRGAEGERDRRGSFK